MKTVCTCGLKVADKAVKPSFTSIIPLGDLPCQHAYQVHEAIAAAPCKVQNLHKDAGDVRAENAFLQEVLFRESGVLDAGSIRVRKVVVGDAGVAVVSGARARRARRPPTVVFDRGSGAMRTSSDGESERGVDEGDGERRRA